MSLKERINKILLETKYPIYWISMFVIILMLSIYIVHNFRDNCFLFSSIILLSAVYIYTFWCESNENSYSNYALSLGTLIIILIV